MILIEMSLILPGGCMQIEVTSDAIFEQFSNRRVISSEYDSLSSKSIYIESCGDCETFMSFVKVSKVMD